jgi:hypothetical protein
MPSLRAQRDEVYDSEALTKVHTGNVWRSGGVDRRTNKNDKLKA